MDKDEADDLKRKIEESFSEVQRNVYLPIGAMGGSYDDIRLDQGTTTDVATAIHQRHLVWVFVDCGRGTTDDSSIQTWKHALSVRSG